MKEVTLKDLPLLNTFKIGERAFYNDNKLSLVSRCIVSFISIDLPKLRNINLEFYSFRNTEAVYLSSISCIEK